MQCRVATLILGVIALAGHAAAEPVVAVVAHNAGSETTDFLVPYGVLFRAAIRVEAVALEAGPVRLHPGDLWLEPEWTADAFDAAHPAGADYVIVPAVAEPDDAVLLAWLARQHGLGATLVSICDGAIVLAHGGFLDGHEATAHWFSLGDLEEDFPEVRWMRNRRFVDAGSVVTTTGVSAAIPASLALVERIAGRERALEVARAFGRTGYSAAHDSNAFAVDTATLRTLAWNGLRFWRRERVGIQADDGADEVAVALTTDGLARTLLALPELHSGSPLVVTRGGLRLRAGSGPVARVEPLPPPGAPPLDHVLASIEQRYGRATAEFVALQLEYERP